LGRGLWLIRWAIRLYRTCKKVLPSMLST